MKKYIYILIAMLVAASCVYPFTPDIDKTEGRLVIEGDIIVGGTTQVKLSYMGALKDYTYDCPQGANVWIENSDGKEFSPYASSAEDGFLSFSIDLSSAPTSSRYRLCVKNHDNGHEYASSWLNVLQSPQIDSVGYYIDEAANQMVIHLSAHSVGNERYYRWMYDEDWEYHSIYRARVYYVPPTGWNKGRNGNWGTIEEYEDGVNTYFCWGRDHSKGILIASTADLTDGRIVNHIFDRKEQDDIKISSLYSVNVKMQALSEDGYKYWDNMDQISSYGGSLFSPNPSEVRGNIRCVSDTTELVLGYINASTESSCRKYIRNADTQFYKQSYRTDIAEEYPEEEWYNRYMYGYIPVDPVYDEMTGEIRGYTWSSKRCVDCRYFGGDKNKPDFWPTTSN